MVAPAPPHKDPYTGLTAPMTTRSNSTRNYALDHTRPCPSKRFVRHDDASQHTPACKTGPRDSSNTCTRLHVKLKKSPIPATLSPDYLVDSVDSIKRPPPAKSRADEAPRYADPNEGVCVSALLGSNGPKDAHSVRQACTQGPHGKRAAQLPHSALYTTFTPTPTPPVAPDAVSRTPLFDFQQYSDGTPVRPGDRYETKDAVRVRPNAFPTSFNPKAANAHRPTNMSSYVKIPSRSDLRDAEYQEPHESSRERSRGRHHRAIPSSSIRHDLPWLLQRRAFVGRPGTPHPERSRTWSNAYGEREAFCDPRPPSQRSRS
ncbi:hypothetical protein C8Q73DRAFT_145663 [Cubamyces lactineus]|nr:hypothetical protein C8Q73DRAFT_145663 [Cubamyces lactineus]